MSRFTHKRSQLARSKRSNAARVHTTVGIRSQELHSGAMEAAFVIIVELIRKGGCIRLSLPKEVTSRVGKTNGGRRHTLADAKAKRKVDTT